MLRINAVWLILFCSLLTATPTRALQVDVSVPDVVILDPTEPFLRTETRNFRIRVLIRSRIPLVSVTVIQNGTDVHKQPIEGSEKERFRYILEYEVSLRPGKNLIEIIARNEKISSKPVSTTIEYQQGTQSSSPPSLSVLAIGVSRSRSSALGPKVASADAQAFAKAMETQKMENGIFGNVQVRTLIDEAVTKDSIYENLKWLQSQNKSPNDIAILFLSGNMEVQYVDNSVYFLTSRYRPKSDLVYENVKYRAFWEFLYSSTGHTLIFADTCWVDEGPQSILERLLAFGKSGGIDSYLASANGAAFILGETSPYSVFTTALLEGLKGSADLELGGRTDRIIDTHELQTWMRWRIENLTGGKQVPLILVSPKRFTLFKLASP